MSGPKISVYSLNGWAREVVMGQMRCEQEALVCAEQIRTMIKNVSGAKSDIERSIAMLELLQKKNGEPIKTIAEIQALRSRMDQEIREMEIEYKRNIPRVSRKYDISDAALASKKQELERIKTVRDKLKSLQTEIDRATNAGQEAGRKEQKKAYTTIADYLSDGRDDLPSGIQMEDAEKLWARIAEDLGGSISFDLSDPESEDTVLKDKKDAIHRELLKLMDQELSSEIVSEIKTALKSLNKITHLSYLSSFESVTVKRLFRTVDAYQRECHAKKAEFEELLARHMILCDMAFKEGEKDRHFETKESIELAIAELEKILIKQQEQSYIADCVDEVMADMGYDLIGRRDVTKRSGKHFKNELFRFGEGTAVNVTYSPEGQISMELGGLARKDRIPSEDETSVLTKDMESFCGEFTEFEQRMKEKGIIVGSRIALMPPTAEYAAIINVNDYDIEAGMQVSEINVTAKRKTITEKKVLRRDN